MQITVNGNAMECGVDASVLDVLAQLALKPEVVVVERNKELVTGELFATTCLAPGDSLEILHFVGGG